MTSHDMRIKMNMKINYFSIYVYIYKLLLKENVTYSFIYVHIRILYL